MRHVVITALIAVLASLATFYIVGNHSSSASPAKETAYERVMRTGVIRCGYAIWNPMLGANPNTHEVNGIAHDVIEAAAGYLGLKVEWTAEYGWGDFVQALQADRMDVFCAGPTPNAARARVVAFTEPFLFGRFPMYTQIDNLKFDNNPEALNSPGVKIGEVDGTTSAKIVAAVFPKANLVGYPESMNISDLFMGVAQRKLDATMMLASAGNIYMQNNPGKIKEIPGLERVRVLPHVMMVKGDETRLRDMLNAGLEEIVGSGKLAEIVHHYDPSETAYLLPAAEYKN